MKKALMTAGVTALVLGLSVNVAVALQWKADLDALRPEAGRIDATLKRSSCAAVALEAETVSGEDGLSVPEPCGLTNTSAPWIPPVWECSGACPSGGSCQDYTPLGSRFRQGCTCAPLPTWPAAVGAVLALLALGVRRFLGPR